MNQPQHESEGGWRMEIKSLATSSDSQIRDTFVDAFSDYEVKMDMSLEKFQEFCQSRSVERSYSLGCFDNDVLVGFGLTGFRETKGQRYFYDSGTGVIPGYRGKKIGNALLKELIALMQEKKIDLFLLEVLENNAPAIALYEKHGFRKTRRLLCFEAMKEDLKHDGASYVKFETTDADWGKLAGDNRFQLYEPTWQNALPSLKNVSEKYVCVKMLEGSQPIAFGFIHKVRGNIPQIGILDGYRNSDVLNELVCSLTQHTTSEKIVMLNVEDGSVLGPLLTEAGFQNDVNQYEMAYPSTL